MEEEFFVRWYQSGDRLRYEHGLLRSNRPGFETEEERQRIGRDIHIVLPDAHILHYESDHTTLIYDQKDWLHRTEGLLRYLAIEGARDLGSYTNYLLDRDSEFDAAHSGPWDLEVKQQDRDGALLFEIRRTHRSESGVTNHRVWIDPLQGFYPTRIERLARLFRPAAIPGESTLRCDITLAPVKSGIWFPKACRRVDHRQNKSMIQRIEDIWHFERIEINEGRLDGRDDSFTIHGLGLHDGSLVVDQRASKGYLNGQTRLTYGTFKITYGQLRSHLELLSDAAGKNLAVDAASHVGDKETYLWDEESRLYLGKEPLCSVFALWSVLALADRARPFDEVRNLFPEVTPHGVSAADLQAAARSAGLACEVVRTDAAGLRRLLDDKIWAILHVNETHFITGVEANSEGVLVADFPKVERMGWEKLERTWGGTALVFAATPQTYLARPWWTSVVTSLAIASGVCAVLLSIIRVWRERWKWNAEPIAH